ncbi:MAG: PAS domain-containing protein [Methylocystis sp.]|uniref:PAS domain-containing protein n=1 Tax=Methylocystis sp. TaxID=1911079 RepID=UPI003DA6663A
MFVVQKDNGIIPTILTQILDSCVNGVTLADPDLPDAPIVYANKAFERMTGYAQEEIVGHNCRFLQGDDREQPGRQLLREALARHEPVEVTLRNYRKNGDMFVNRLNLRPLRCSSGKLMYYLGVQYDVTEMVRAEEEIGKLGDRLRLFEKA